MNRMGKLIGSMFVGILFASVASAAPIIPGTYVLNGADSGGDPTGSYTIGPTGGNNQFTPSSPLKFGEIGLVSIDYSITGALGIGGGSPRLYFRIDNAPIAGVQDATPYGGRINVYFQDVPGLGLSGSTGNLMIPALYTGSDGHVLNAAEIAVANDYNIMQIRLGNDADHTVTYNNFRIEFAEVPEPASAALLGASGLLLTLVRRKRR
jgi:hypothetical protein